MVAACHKDLLDDKQAGISLLDWKSWKLKRVCRSSLSAECQAMAEALVNLIFVRLFWEVLIGRVKPTLRIDQDDILKSAPTSCLVTDCKGLCRAWSSQVDTVHELPLPPGRGNEARSGTLDLDVSAAVVLQDKDDDMVWRLQQGSEPDDGDHR